MKKLFTLIFIACISTAYSQFPDIGLGASDVEAPNGTLVQIDVFPTGQLRMKTGTHFEQ